MPSTMPPKLPKLPNPRQLQYAGGPHILFSKPFIFPPCSPWLVWLCRLSTRFVMLLPVA